MPPCCSAEAPTRAKSGGAASAPSLAGSLAPTKRPGSFLGMQAEQPRRLRQHHECVRQPTWGDRQPTGRDTALTAVHMHQDLTGQHMHRLVGLGVAMQRRHLAPLQLVLEEQKGSAGLLGSRLPDVQTAAPRWVWASPFPSGCRPLIFNGTPGRPSGPAPGSS